nr:uncharacterized protein LOC115269687 [Aedes albopictus]
MEAKTFRTIGFVYLVIFWIFSTLGVIYTYLHIVVGKPFCVNVLCYEDKISTGIVTLCMVGFVLSTVFIAFVKSAIEQANASFVGIYRPIVLLRNVLLTALWIYQYTMLEMERTRGDTTSEVRTAEYITLALLVGTTVITGLELWVLSGIQRLTNHRLEEEECIEAV